MDDYERFAEPNSVHHQIWDALACELAKDGYAQPGFPGIFVKPITGSWRAWISVGGRSVELTPLIGVFDEELFDIRMRALETLGRTFPRRQDGPPLIMPTLERLAANCPACSTDAPWRFSGEILKTSVADDLVACLRKHAYPFLQAHASLPAVFDAWKNKMGGYSMPFYVPIVLIKLARLDALTTYVDSRLRRIPDEGHALEYRQYVNTILRMFSLPDLPDS